MDFNSDGFECAGFGFMCNPNLLLTVPEFESQCLQKSRERERGGPYQLGNAEFSFNWHLAEDDRRVKHSELGF